MCLDRIFAFFTNQLSQQMQYMYVYVNMISLQAGIRSAYQVILLKDRFNIDCCKTVQLWHIATDSLESLRVIEVWRYGW